VLFQSQSVPIVFRIDDASSQICALAKVLDEAFTLIVKRHEGNGS